MKCAGFEDVVNYVNCSHYNPLYLCRQVVSLLTINKVGFDSLNSSFYYLLNIDPIVTARAQFNWVHSINEIS